MINCFNLECEKMVRNKKVIFSIEKSQNWNRNGIKTCLERKLRVERIISLVDRITNQKGKILNN